MLIPETGVAQLTDCHPEEPATKDPRPAVCGFTKAERYQRWILQAAGCPQNDNNFRTLPTPFDG